MDSGPEARQTPPDPPRRPARAREVRVNRRALLIVVTDSPSPPAPRCSGSGRSGPGPADPPCSARPPASATRRSGPTSPWVTSIAISSSPRTTWTPSTSGPGSWPRPPSRPRPSSPPSPPTSSSSAGPPRSPPGSTPGSGWPPSISAPAGSDPAEQAAREYLKRGHEADARGHRLLAEALEGVGRVGDSDALAQAVAEYEAAEAIEPGDVQAAGRLAALCRDRFDDRPRALAVLDALIRHNPGSPAARLARSRFFLAGGDAKLAAEEIDAALKLAPGDVDARLAAAEAAAIRDDPRAAREHLAAIQPPRPDDIRVRIIEGLIELDESRADEAVRSWRAGLVLSGGTDAELTWRLTHVLIQLGRLREAEPLLSQFRRLTGGDEPTPACRYLIGLASLKAGRVADAVAELEAVRYKVDRDLEGLLYLALGRAYEASREPEKAADALARAAGSPGAGAEPWLALARLLAAERPDEELPTLEKAVAAVGPDSRLLAAQARALRARQLAIPPLGRSWGELDDLLARAEKVAPGSPELAPIRAEHAADLGRPGDAPAILDAALERSPTSVPLWMAQVDALVNLGRYDEAEARLVLAREAAGDHAPFRVARARLALRKGEVKAARLALAEGIEKVPADQLPGLWRAIGEFHLTQADPANARRAYLEWAKLQPDIPEPRVALLNLAIESGDDPAIAAEVEALRRIGGPGSVPWKVARAEYLLRDRPRSELSPAGLGEAAALIADVKAMSPRQPAGHLLEARLLERRKDDDGAIRAYEKAIELKAGPLAVRPLAALLARLGRRDDLEALRARAGDLGPEIASLAGRPPAGDPAPDLARRLTEENASAPEDQAKRARDLGALGRPEEAERMLREAIDKSPEAPTPWLELLMFQVARNELAAASETADRMRGRVKTGHPELLAAICLRLARQSVRADAAFEAALKVGPDDPATIQAAVDHYEATARPERAELLLRRILASQPGLDWARRRLALDLAGKVNDGPAWSEALRLVGEHPDPADTPDDRLARASVLAMGPPPRRAEAVTMLQALAADLPANARVREALARARLATGDLAGARAEATRAAGAADAPASTVRLLASLALSAGDPSAAARLLPRLDASGTDDAPGIDLKARILKATGRPADAVALVEKAYAARESTAEGPPYSRFAVHLLSAIGEPAAAERVARRAADRGGSGTVLLAEVLGSSGRFEEATSLYEAAGRDPAALGDAARSVTTLATLTNDRRWADLADRLLDRVAAAEPGSAELLYGRAALRHLQGRDAESVALYDELASRGSAHLGFLNNCAWILSEEMNRPDEGLKRINALIGALGEQPRTLDTRGVILTRLGRLPEAIRDLEAAAASAPSAGTSYHLARAYLAAGRKAEAAGAADRARASGLKPADLQPSERAEMSRVMAACAP